jgi:hypothetical protein
VINKPPIIGVDTPKSSLMSFIWQDSIYDNKRHMYILLIGQGSKIAGLRKLRSSLSNRMMSSMYIKAGEELLILYMTLQLLMLQSMVRHFL